MIPSYSPGGTD